MISRNARSWKVSRENLSVLVKAAPFGIVAVDTAGKIWLWNAAAEDIIGWKEDELVGRSFTILFPPERREEQADLHKKILSREVYYSVPVEFFTKGGSTITISYSIAPVVDDRDRVVGSLALFFDMTEKVRLEVALQESVVKMGRVLEETIHALGAAIEQRDPYTSGHQQRVAELAGAIAAELPCDATSIKGITMAALVHDIGKLYIPAEFLMKPGHLTELELSVIKTHPKAGYDILSGIDFPWPVAQTVLQHHERIDGTGYPLGLAGAEVCLEARVVAVADVVEAVGWHRPYRAAKGIDAALGEIREGRGTSYDPEVVDACIRVFAKGFEFTSR